MAEYIDKDEALAIIENKQREICPMGRYSRHAVYGSDREAFDNWQEIVDEIDAIQAADVAPVRHGRWIYHDDGVITCSECDNAECHESNYCRYCGAKMDLEATKNGTCRKGFVEEDGNVEL